LELSINWDKGKELFDNTKKMKEVFQWVYVSTAENLPAFCERSTVNAKKNGIRA
jgi:hypothetical protein